MNTPAIIIIILIIIVIIIIPYGRINSRMTSYLKFSVLIDFRFQDAIFPFNRGTARQKVMRCFGTTLST